MDKQTLGWLNDAIDTAPNDKCLDGIISTLKWMYTIEKEDAETYESLVERILNRRQLIQA